MPKPQKFLRDGKTYYRVRFRRPSKGVNIDEYFPTKRAADNFIRTTELELEHGRPVTENVRARERFADAVATYLDDDAAFLTPKGLPLKPSSAKDRKNRMEFLSKNVFGSVQLKRLTWEYIDEKLLAETKKRNWSPASRYRYETTLSRFLNYATRKRWVAFNVMKDQERLNHAEQRKRTYKPEEWQKLLAQADLDGGMLALFLRLAWATGCRKSELVNLRWVDVDSIDHETLGASISIMDSKNHEDRKVFIDKRLHRLLLAHEQEYRKPGSSLVFPSRNRDGRYGVDQPFQQARASAGLDEPDERYGEVLSIHHIRHTWATRLGDSGASLAQIMAAGGWKTASMAMRYMKRQETQSAEAAMLLRTNS